jgi:K(+)-stimulated pyrophosphate-energized sodium pump
MNPVIKFTTLFGLLAVEIAVTMKDESLKRGIGIVFFVIALIFVYRSFYCMRIPDDSSGMADEASAAPRSASGAKPRELTKVS